MNQAFDLIVFGATGFTGRLVAEYLLKTYGVGGAVTWAMAGRNLDKLAATRREIGAPQTLPLLQADASDAAALAALVPQAKVILSTVGPYQLHGEPLVQRLRGRRHRLRGPVRRAAVDGADDRRATRPRPAPAARASSSPAASIRSPSTWAWSSCRTRRSGASAQPLQHVRGRVRVMKGGFSGGTMASALATVEAIGRDPAWRAPWPTRLR